MNKKILTKDDLHFFLECDKAALNIDRKHPKLFKDKIWKFQILLRKTEYLSNKKGFVYKFLYYFFNFKYKRKCEKFGLEIPLNVIGEGLVIWHLQKIIINSKAKIGKNCSISAGVTIGQAHDITPVIYDNVELTIDSKVLGTEVASHTVIGAGAVVVKPILDEYSVWAGVPAKKISSNFPKSNVDRELRVLKVANYLKKDSGQRVNVN